MANWWENDPIAGGDAPSGGDWWASDPVAPSLADAGQLPEPQGIDDAPPIGIDEFADIQQGPEFQSLPAESQANLGEFFGAIEGSDNRKQARLAEIEKERADWMARSDQWDFQDHARYHEKELPLKMPADVLASPDLAERYARINELLTGEPYLAPGLTRTGSRNRDEIAAERAAMEAAGVTDPVEWVQRKDAAVGSQNLAMRLPEEAAVGVGAGISHSLKSLLGRGNEIRTDELEEGWREGIESLKDSDSWLGKAVAGTLRKTANVAGRIGPTMGAAALTKNPTAAYGILGGQSGVDAFGSVRARGWSWPAAALYGAASGAIETATEVIGGKIAGGLGLRTAEEAIAGTAKTASRGLFDGLKNSTARALVEGMAGAAMEGGEEVLADVLHGVKDTVARVDPTGDPVESFIIGTLIGGAAHVPSFANFLLKPTPKNTERAGIPQKLAPRQADRDRIADLARTAIAEQSEATEAPTSPVDALPPETAQEPLPPEIATPGVPPEASAPMEDAASVQARSVVPVGEPPIAPGMVRFYHGGTGGGKRAWLSPDRQYAEGYANKTPGAGVYYVDIPESSDLLSKAYDDTGTDQPAPYGHFEAPPELTQQLQPLTDSVAPLPSPESAAPVGDGVEFEEAGRRGWRRVYHGTTAEFKGAELRPARSGDYTGYYFTEDPKQAKTWGRFNDGYEDSTQVQPRTIEAYVDLKNPANFADVKAAKAAVKEKYGAGWTSAQLTDELKSQGFDGVVDDTYIGNEVVVFDKGQVSTNPTSDFREAINADAFRSQIAAAAMSPEEADALYGLVEARAEAAGESVDDYVGRRFKAVEKTDRKSSTTVRQGTSKNPRGEVEFVKDGRAIIRAFTGTQDISTLAHELGHVFRRDLKDADLDVAAKWAGAKKAKDGSWKWASGRNIEPEEKFARGFEKYLRTGKAPTPRLKRIFAQFRDWLGSVYKRLKGSPIDVPIPPEMAAVYDNLFVPTAEKSVIDDTNSEENRVIDEQVSEPPSGSIYTPEGENALENTGETQVPANSSDESIYTPPASEAPSTEPLVQTTFFQSVEDRFRGLANQTAIPEARHANYDVDVEMGFPERKAREAAKAAARARIASDPSGRLRHWLKLVDEANATGGTIDLREMIDTAEINFLKEHASTKLGDPEARAIHRKLHEAFRKSRTEQARSLGFQDPVSAANPEERRRKNLTDAISEPTAEEEAERDAARTPEEHAAVDAKIEERYRIAKGKLAKLGIDIDDLDSIVADPRKAMIVLDHFRPKAASRGDKLYEYWRNSILSGPRTQLTNVLGNTAFTAWNLGPERAAEAFVNLFMRDKKAASFGEFKHLAGGLMPGVLRGLRNASTAWRLESSALADELGREGAFKIEGARGAIPGKLGRLVRAFGYRPLLAADEFAKSVIVTMEVGARAFRAGKNRGLKGEKLQEFVAEQVDNLDSFAWSSAFAKAEELTFQGRRGMLAEGLAAGGNKLRSGKLGRAVGRWIVPFVDTPAAIIEEGVRRMPVLGAILDYAESRRNGANMADAGMTPTLARQLIALGGMALIWGGVDDDDPWITGAAVMTDKAARDVAYRTFPPMSIRIGDKWVSYDKIEPFATATAFTVDAVRGLKGGAPLSEVAFSSFQQIKNKSYLDGLGDAVDAVQGIGAGETGAFEEYIGKFASSFVPNLYRQTVSSADPTIPDRRVWGKEWEHAQRVLRRAGEGAQLPGFDPEPRYDIWGRPLRYSDTFGSPVTDFAWNLLSPVKTKDADKVTQADLALARWNSQHPDDRQVWSEPQRAVEDNGERHSLSDEQYADYAKLSGEIARYAVEQLKFDADNPTEGTVLAIGNMLRKAREAARAALLPRWRQEWGASTEAPGEQPTAREMGNKLLADYAESTARRAVLSLNRPTREREGQPLESLTSEWEKRRDEAARWLRDHQDSPAVQSAVQGVLTSDSFQRAISVPSSRIMKPAEREKRAHALEMAQLLAR
jgi:hypothetical protein